MATNKGFFVAVGSFVVHQMMFAGRCVTALVALEGSFAGVGAFVILYVAFLFGGVLATFATKDVCCLGFFGRSFLGFFGSDGGKGGG